MRERIEYIAVCLGIKILGFLPRHLARFICGNLATFASCLLRKKKPLQTAYQSLKIAFPELNETQRRRIMQHSIRHLGWMIAEFAHFPHYDRSNFEKSVIFDGLGNYVNAVAKGKGVLILTGHFTAFELFPIAFGLAGFTGHYLVRAINNARIDAFATRYRSLGGFVPIHKDRSAKSVLSILRSGGTVGVTIDQNSSASEGIFINFFNKLACTTTGAARFALQTNATVIPAFLFWDRQLSKYRLQFDPALEIIRTGDKLNDIRENTMRFTEVIVKYVKLYPDQWTRWVHNRWKTRPSEENLSLESKG